MMTSLNERTPLLHVGKEEGGVGQSSFTEVAVDSGKKEDGHSLTAGQPTPIHLGWQNVSVGVTVRQGLCGRKAPPQVKQILRNVSGLVAPGTLLAIIGASGAGKSTLLNVLTGRNISSYDIQGEITINGVVVGRGIKALSAYVQQDELFMSTLSVREHLVFRALLRMDSRLGRAQRMSRVKEVIREMGLTKCADSRIGKPGTDKSISGGEMKRLSFASEILTNPPLMFCDEPTSGLDSFMAQNIVQTLKTSASLGRTILCTIHQPSSEIFAMFDTLLLLAEGRVAYMGPTHMSVDFFNQLGHPCPPNFNPADHYVLTLAIVPGKEDECQQRVEAVCDAYSHSEQRQQMMQELDGQMQHSNQALNTPLFEEMFSGNSQYESSWCTQLRVVLWRSWINSVRDVVLFRVRIGQTMIVALVLGLIFLQLTYDQTGVMDINGAIFLMVTNMSFTSIFAVVNSFPIEIGIFLREYGTGLYRSDVYFLSKTFAELPSFMLLPIIFSSVTYWMIGLYNDVIAFLICTAILVLTALVAVSFGYVVSTITASVDIALAIGPPILIPFMMFGGFFLNSKSVPDYFIWLEYISWFKYSNEIIVVNQWRDTGDLVCDVPKNSSEACGRCFPNGTYVINYLNFSEDHVIPNIAALVALMVGFRVASYIFLLIRARRSSA